MRNISILIFFLLQGVGGQVLGQQHHLSIKADSVYDKLRYQKDDLLNEYHCNGKYVQAVQQAVINKNLHGIYEAIIPNAQGLSNNGSAFTYAQDANKQTLGISAFFPFPNKRIFFHTEIYTEASNGLFNLYSSGSWNNNVAFGFGLSGVISSSQYINENCGVYDDERKMYADSILLDYANKLAVEINNLIEEKKILNDKIDSVLSIQNPKQIVSDTSNLNLTKKIKGLTKKINEYNELIEIAREEKSKAHFAEKLAEFDAKKNILYGYSVYWWNIHTSFANTTLNLADSVGTKDVYTKNHPTIRIRLNYRIRLIKIINKKCKYFSSVNEYN